MFSDGLGNHRPERKLSVTMHDLSFITRLWRQQEIPMQAECNLMAWQILLAKARQKSVLAS